MNVQETNDKLAEVKQTAISSSITNEMDRISHVLTELQKTLAGREDPALRPFGDPEENESELRDKDPRSHVTKTMTLGKVGVLEQVSEVPSPELLRYVVFQDICAQLMSPLFDLPRCSQLSHLISKDRQSRKEYTEILKGSYYPDQFGGIYSSGPQILRKPIMDMQGESEND